MSLAAQGGYRNFLDVGWQHGGRVPNHPGAFQGFAMCKSAREWKRIEKEVLQMFTVSSEGKWLLNDTLTEQWNMASAKMSEISEKRSQAGSKGAARRWHADTTPIANAWQAHGKPIANHSTLPDPTLPDQTLANQTLPDQTQEPDSTARSASRRDDDLFAKAYEAYPRHVGRRAAEEAWSAAIRRESAKRAASRAEHGDWIYQRVITYAAMCAKHHKPREYIPHMATWLNEDRFLDDPSEWAVNGGKPNGAGNYKTASAGNYKTASAGLQSRNVQALVLDGMGAGVSRSHVPDGRAVQPGAPNGDRGAPGALTHHAVLEGKPAALKPGADA
jgi:hypothetical protein